MKPLAKPSLFVVLFLLSSVSLGQDKWDDFDSYVEKAMAAWQVPGLAIVVLHDGKTIYEQAFGVREAGRPDKVDLETVFALSSTGKAYTATLAGMLVDDGKLSWDDPVSRYLDYFQLPDPWVTRQVTLRDLLAHRVAGDLGIGKLELWAFTNQPRDEVLRGLRHLQIGPNRFRSEFQYSNPNISAAGQAVGVAGASTWDDLMEERLLQGLGMRRATSSVTALWPAEDIALCYMCDLAHQPRQADAHIDNIAMPHVGSESGPVPIPWRTVDNIAPAGSINSSVRDFAKFVQLHLNQGQIEGRQLLSPATIKEMHRPQIVVNSPPYPAVSGFSRHWSYGLGWFISEYRGHKLVMHTGGITGWRSGMVMLPEQGLGVAMVSNGHGAHLPNTLVPALAFVVFDRVLGLPETDHSAEWLAATHRSLEQIESYIQSLEDQKNPNEYRQLELRQIAGSYRHPAFGELRVEANGRLRLAGIIGGTFEHWNGDRYGLTWDGPWPYRNFISFFEDRLELDGLGTFLKQ